MNPKERAILVFLTATFLVGAGVTAYRRAGLARRAAGSPIIIEKPVDTADFRDVLIDLNRAQSYELEALPGIGPKLARRIIEYRERHGGFSRVSQLREVSGIGPKRYAAICELVTVGAPETRALEQDSLSGDGGEN